MGFYWSTFVFYGFYVKIKDIKIEIPIQNDYCFPVRDGIFIYVPCTRKTVGSVGGIIKNNEKTQGHVLFSDLIQSNMLTENHFKCSIEEIEQVNIYAHLLKVDLINLKEYIVESYLTTTTTPFTLQHVTCILPIKNGESEKSFPTKTVVKL